MRKLPLAVVFVIDVLIATVVLGVFTLFYYVIPQHSDVTQGEMVAQLDETEVTFTIDVEQETDKTNLNQTNETTSQRNSKNNSNYNDRKKNQNKTYIEKTTATDTTTEKNETIQNNNIENTLSIDNTKITELQTYESSELNITISKAETEKVTYFIADVFISSLSEFKTAFAGGTYGKNIRSSILDMANENNAMLAISGDFYGNSEKGIVIRNGVLYRNANTGSDICVLYIDGTMETYSAQEFNSEEVLKKGAYQAWTFGPMLLNEGRAMTQFNTSSYLMGQNPRCAIGYYEPGHYVFITVDGRDDGYSEGMTLVELSSLFKELGCAEAYNLDGGKSATMVWNGEYINQPASGGRTISDIIYFGNAE